MEDKNLGGKENYNIVLNVDGHEKRKPFDFFILLDVLIKHKLILLATAVLFAIIGVSIAVINTPIFYSASATLIFNYEGIEKGLNPAGQRLDISGIRAPHIINEAVKDISLQKYKLTEDDLRNTIEIEPIIPGSVTEKVKSLQEAQKQNIKEMEEYSYYPNRYIISLGLNKKWNMDKKDAKLILDKIITVYSKKFYEEFSPQPFVANSIKDIKLESYDYPDMAEIITSQITLLNSFLTNKAATTPNFRSNATGLTFDDIFKSVDTLRSVDVDLMNSLVDSYNLTKDKTMRMRIYEFRIKELLLLADKKEDEKKVTSTALDRLDKNNQIYYNPNSSTSEVKGNDLNLYKVEVVNPKYNELITRFTESGVTATNSRRSVDDLRVKIERLKEDAIPPAEKDMAAVKATNIAQRVKDKLLYWIDITNKTTDDYYKKMPLSSAVKALSPAQVQLNVNKLKFIIFGVGAAFMGFTLLYAFLLLKLMSNLRRKSIAATTASDAIITEDEIKTSNGADEVNKQ